MSADYIHEEYEPIADLSIIGMNGVEEIIQKIDNYLLDWRKDEVKEKGVNTYKLNAKCIRFGKQRELFMNLLEVMTYL